MAWVAGLERKDGNAALALTVIFSAGWGFAFGFARPIGMLAVGVALFIVLYAFAPPMWQWCAFFGVASAVPLAYLSVPQWMQTLTPWPFLLVIILIGHLLRGDFLFSAAHHWRNGAAWTFIAWVAWLAVCVVVSDSRKVALGWLTSFGTLVVLPCVITFLRPDPVRRARAGWAWFGAALGLYAIAETFVFGYNPLAPIIYGHGGALEQDWGSYRATTTLGHPLNNGLYFSIGFVIALDFFNRGHSRWYLAAVLLNLGGVVATGSRGALIAVAIGFILVSGGGLSMLSSRKEGRGSSLHIRLGAGWALAVVAGSVIPVLMSTRLQSAEAARSGAFRLRQIPVALDAVDSSPIVGVGPGVASDSHASLLRGIGGAGAFESFWLEVAVGSGIVGLTLCVLFFATIVGRSLRRADWGGAAVVVTWLVNATSVNAFEGTRSEQYILGFALAVALAGYGAPVSRGGRLRFGRWAANERVVEGGI